MTELEQICFYIVIPEITMILGFFIGYAIGLRMVKK
jgi:hypothetical protein